MHFSGSGAGDIRRNPGHYLIPAMKQQSGKLMLALKKQISKKKNTISPISFQQLKLNSIPLI
jgi:hypothetical protein